MSASNPISAHSVDETVLAVEPNDEVRASLSEVADKLDVKLRACSDLRQLVSLLDEQADPASVLALAVSTRAAFGPECSLPELLADRFRAPPVLLMSAHSSQKVSDAVLRRAFFAFLPPMASTDAMTQALASTVQEGRSRASDRHLVGDYRRREAQLTHDERLVLQAVCEGKLNKQIAKELGVSVRTIEQRRRRVFTKMNVASAAPLAQRVAIVHTLERVHGPQTRPATPSGMRIAKRPDANWFHA